MIARRFRPANNPEDDRRHKLDRTKVKAWNTNLGEDQCCEKTSADGQRYRQISECFHLKTEVDADTPGGRSTYRRSANVTQAFA